MWFSVDKGATWNKQMQMTSGSKRNHTFVRNVINAHPEFVSLWADGHGRQPSDSRLFFSDSSGNVFQLPQQMDKAAAPIPLKVSH